jgi:hypothetical protein
MRFVQFRKNTTQVAMWLISGRLFARLAPGCAEQVGAKQLKKLSSCAGNTCPAPLANGWRLDLAKTRNLSGSTEVINDFRIGMGVGHGRNIGFPMPPVNSHTYGLGI